MADANTQENPVHKQGPPSAAERQRAYLSLFNQKDARHFPALMQALRDPDPYVRYTGAWVLNPNHMDEIGTPSFLDGSFKKWKPPLTPNTSKWIVSALLQALPEEDPWARREILEALLAHQEYQLEQGLPMNEDGKEIFLIHMKAPDPLTRLISAKGLLPWEKVFRNALSDQYWATQQEALTSRHRLVRKDAILWLTREHKNNPGTYDLLISRLGDPDHWVVEVTIRGLGLMRDARALKPLLSLKMRSAQWYPEQPSAIEKITGKPFDEILLKYQNETKNSPRILEDGLTRGNRFD